jgi:hypothetical protein
MWWLCIDAGDTAAAAEGEPMDLTWFVAACAASVPLHRQLPVHTGDEVWLWERPFRRLAGLAHAASEPYQHRGNLWWLDITVDHPSTAALRDRPLRHSAVVLRDEPWRYGTDDPWLLRMNAADLNHARQHLASLPKR